MTDQSPHPHEPPGSGPEPAVPTLPGSQPAGSEAAPPGPAAGSRHYRDLANARELRSARASLGAGVRLPATPNPPGPDAGPTTGPGRPDGIEGGRSDATPVPSTAPGWARRRLAWALPEIKAAAFLFALLLAGVVAAVLPEGLTRAPIPLPGLPAVDPGAQVPGPDPATTVQGNPATTAPGQAGTSPVRDGQVSHSPGLTSPFGRESGSGAPLRSPTTWVPPASQPGQLPVPPTVPTSPPTTLSPATTTTSTAPTKSTRATRPTPPSTTRLKSRGTQGIGLR